MNQEIYLNKNILMEGKNIKKIAKNLYFQEGMSIRKVAEIIEKKEKWVEEIINQGSPIKIETSGGSFHVRKLKKNEIGNYSDNLTLLEPEILDLCEINDYLKEHNIHGVPEFFYFMSLFFGESLKFNRYKSTYHYVFHLKYNPNNDQDSSEYIFALFDKKGAHYSKFYKIHKRDKQEKRETNVLTEQQMKIVHFWFLALVKNAVEYVEDRNIYLKKFCNTIDSERIIYGYYDDGFFIKQYEEGEKYHSEKKQYKRKLQGEQNDRISEETISFHEIMDRTNQYSLVRYELTLLFYDIYITFLLEIMSDRLTGDSTKALKSDINSICSFILYNISFEDNKNIEIFHEKHLENLNKQLAQIKVDNTDLIKTRVDLRKKYSSEKISRITNIIRQKFITNKCEFDTTREIQKDILENLIFKNEIIENLYFMTYYLC